MDITVPAPEMTVGQLRNLVFLLYSKQYLISKMTHAEILNVPDILVERLKDFTPESPQAFTEMLDDARAVAELDGFDYRDVSHSRNVQSMQDTIAKIVDMEHELDRD